MVLRMRVIVGVGLFAISMLPTSCRTVPASQGHSPAEGPLEVESKKLAGPGAIDCSRVDPKDAIQCAIAAESVPASQGHIPAEDRLEVESKRLAGPGAIDCGRVAIKGNPKDATQCAIAAQKAAKPFRVRYDMQGIDSAVAVAIVRTPVGTVDMLTYDSDPSGGSYVGEVVYPKPCPEPVHLWIDPSGRIDCFQQETSPRKDVMAPNAEPY